MVQVTFTTIKAGKEDEVKPQGIKNKHDILNLCLREPGGPENRDTFEICAQSAGRCSSRVKQKLLIFNLFEQLVSCKYLLLTLTLYFHFIHAI